MISLVDYGLGNLQAFATIYRRLGVRVTLARVPGEILGAKRLILPGVGAFDWAMARLNASGLRDAVDEAVLGKKVPVLGVCVGLQMMGLRSEEGALPGLGWIDADVIRFPMSDGRVAKPLPHMGWNDVQPLTAGCVFNSIESPRYYFLHSYLVTPNDPADVLATTVYRVRFASAIRRGNIWGTQFHPEKSHHWGVQLLKNFSEI